MATAAEAVETQVEPDDQLDADDQLEADEEDEATAAEEESVDPENRCEAVTTVGGNEYRCALNAEHDADHKFQPVAGDTTPQPELDPKAFDREATRHEKALAKLYGAAWDDRTMCPLCVGEGFMTPLPAGVMPPEQFAAVTALAGYTQEVELQNDEDYVVCQNCAGWGSTKIKDSKREGLSKQCDRCLGQGYVKTTNVTQLPQAYVIPGPAEIPAPAAPVSYGAPGPNDAWGRPTGHTHYGVPPAAVT